MPVGTGLGKVAIVRIMHVDTLASGPGWRVHDIVCSAGPRDRAFEEQHQAVCVAIVLEGSFQYRTTQGTATLVPGSVLLGNHQHCFECGHEHVAGDRCLSFLFDPNSFDTILRAIPGVRRSAFTVPRLPPLAPLAPLIAAADVARLDGDTAALEACGLELAGQVVAVLSDADSRRAASFRDRRRITAALRRIELGFQEPLCLSDLAEEARMSRYHFLRTFREVAGVTPHQLLLRTRLHRAAVALRRSAQPVLDVALESGFADLSTFNRQFRRAMGVNPTRFRASPNS